MVQQKNMAVAGAGELSLCAFQSGADTNENKWWSTGKADTDFSQNIEDGGEIEVPGSSWDNMGKVLAATSLPGSLKVTFTILMFSPRSMAIALSGKMPTKQSFTGGPAVSIPFTFSADWKQELVGYQNVDLVTTPPVVVDAATGVQDYTDQVVFETGPGVTYIRPAEGATLEDGTELEIDLTELSYDGYDIEANTIPAEFTVAATWLGKNLLAGGKYVTHRIPKMTIKPTSAINWQAKEAQSCTFEGTPQEAVGFDYVSLTKWIED